MYGKEGKRASYTPYPCPKIIVGNPPQSGDHHGCPFRHYDDDHLSQLLGSLSLSDKNAILSLKKNHNYQLACTKHFEVLHPNAASAPDVQLDNVGNHPNSWFAASVSYHSSKKLGADKQDKEMDAVAL
jgi:DNA primase large subunit